MVKKKCCVLCDDMTKTGMLVCQFTFVFPSVSIPFFLRLSTHRSVTFCSVIRDRSLITGKGGGGK